MPQMHFRDSSHERLFAGRFHTRICVRSCFFNNIFSVSAVVQGFVCNQFNLILLRFNCYIG